MLVRARVRHPPKVLFPSTRSAMRLSLYLLLIITSQMRAQQLGSSPEPVSPVEAASNSSSSDDSKEDSNPRVVAEPGWVITRDSAGNVDQRINVRSDFAVGEH